MIPWLEPLLVGASQEDFVFKGVKGNCLNDGWFRKAVFGPAVKKLGWTDITIHNLRHTCASLLISNGTPITTVSKVLGHSTVVQTLNTYGHYYEDDMLSSMESLSNMFDAPRGSKGDSHKVEIKNQYSNF